MTVTVSRAGAIALIAGLLLALLPPGALGLWPRLLLLLMSFSIAAWAWGRVPPASSILGLLSDLGLGVTLFVLLWLPDLMAPGGRSAFVPVTVAVALFTPWTLGRRDAGLWLLWLLGLGLAAWLFLREEVLASDRSSLTQVVLLLGYGYGGFLLLGEGLTEQRLRWLDVRWVRRTLVLLVVGLFLLTIGRALLLWSELSAPALLASFAPLVSMAWFYRRRRRKQRMLPTLASTPVALQPALLVTGLLLIATLAIAGAWETTQLLVHGRLVLLPLAADVELRTENGKLRLDYDRPAIPPAGLLKALPIEGWAVLTLDEHDVGHFLKIADQPEPVTKTRVTLRYRLKNIRSARPWVAYGPARVELRRGETRALDQAAYAVFRVGLAGRTAYVGLADHEGRRLR